MDNTWPRKSDLVSPSQRRRDIDMEIIASQDRSCLNRTKYIYRFGIPIKESIIHNFLDCEIQNFRFSQISIHSKDLIKIKKLNQFQVDFVIGGSIAVVYFMGVSESFSIQNATDFNKCLRDAGLGEVRYVVEHQTHCDPCPVRHLKNCSSTQAGSHL